MIIPLEITKHLVEPKNRKPSMDIRIGLVATLLFPRLGLRPMKFIVDTGSPRTFISPTDAIKFKLQDYVKEDSIKDSIRMGETEIILGKINNIIMYTKTDNKTIHHITLPDLSIAKTQIMLDPTNAMKIESILGLDFIIANNFDFHYLPNHDKAYFEKVE